MQGIAGIFFAGIVLVALVTYLAIRREWFAPGLTAGASVVISIILMVLTSLAQGNSALQAIIVGILIGGIFSGATVGIAWYFHNQELQKRYADDAYYEQQPDEAG